jgi:hypothetical protein
MLCLFVGCLIESNVAGQGSNTLRHRSTAQDESISSTGPTPSMPTSTTPPNTSTNEGFSQSPVDDNEDWEFVQNEMQKQQPESQQSQRPREPEPVDVDTIRTN